MRSLINKSSRMVIVQWKRKNNSIKRIMFPPLKLIEIQNDDWMIIKSIGLVSRMLDEDEFVEGKKAVRSKMKDDDVREELKKDLTDDEKDVLAKKC